MNLRSRCLLSPGLAMVFALLTASCCATPPLASDHFDLRSPVVTVRGFLYASKFDDPEHAERCVRRGSDSWLEEWSEVAREARFETASEIVWTPVGDPDGDRGLVLAPAEDRWIAFSVVAERFLFDELQNEWRPIRPDERARFDAASPRDAETDWRIVNVEVVERAEDAMFVDPAASAMGEIES